ncbi:MAG: hypothetical protein ACYCUI_17250 [Vulcanimicrobiaceae bacterium]
MYWLTYLYFYQKPLTPDAFKKALWADFEKALQVKVGREFPNWEESITLLHEAIRHSLLPRKPRTILTPEVKNYLTDPKNKATVEKLFEAADITILTDILNELEAPPQQGTLSWKSLQ